MPNSTPPDCVHCRYMERQRDGEYRCKQHDMTLHTPVRVFCRQIVPSADDDAYNQWFDAHINAEELQPNLLYLWVETVTRNANDTATTHIDNEVVAPITSYLTWSAGTFWQVLRRIRESRREHYRQHGYDVDE